MNQARLFLLAFAFFAAIASRVDAQTGFGRPTAGIFGGYTHPNGDFKVTSGDGWHVGGLLKIRAYGILDARLDGTYTKLGKKDILVGLAAGDTAAIHTAPTMTYGTITALLNLGPDSAAYPGDNSAAPYILAGLGMYHLDFNFSCTRSCATFPETDAKNHMGVNVGGGVTAPLLGIRTFVEGRYHRISRKATDGGSRSFFTISAGVKIR